MERSHYCNYPNMYKNIEGVDQIYNKDISANTYVGYIPKSQRNYIPPNDNIESINTMNPHPLARYSHPSKYVQGYADPSFSGGEYTRGLSFKDHDARKILSHDKHENLPILNVYGEQNNTIMDNNVFETIDDVTPIEKIRNIFEPPKTNNDKPMISPILGTVPGKYVPLYPEIRPYVMKDPAKEQEPFNFSFNGGPNGIPRIEMTESEYDEITGMFKPNEGVNLNKSIKIQIPPSSGYSSISSSGGGGGANGRCRTCNLKENERFIKNLEGYFPKETFQPKIQSSIVGGRGDNNLLMERFTDDVTSRQAINNYIEALKTRATAVCFYLRNNASYKRWSENWEFLESNLKKSKLLFERLDESDADIAYVINKGEEIKFRIRDEKRFIPLNIYQYVLYHEMAHLSTHELQHTPKFHELLNIISLAGFELGFIDLTRVQRSFYLTNGQPILCKASLKEEIIEGCQWLIKANPGAKEYYKDLIDLIKYKY